MSVIYSATSAKYLRDIFRITNTRENQENVSKRKRKSLKKLYNNDTSKFEPIPENREHLINCLMPMVVKLTNQRIKTYGLPNEFSDVLSAGFQGAIIATDLYIEKSKTEVQPAKLSTYAYSYIIKYINEYMYKNQSILSFGPTKGREVREKQIYRGNSIGTSQNSDFKEEYFETSGEANLMTIDEYDNSSELSEQYSYKLFNCLSTEEKKMLFMFFGIGYERSIEIKQIASNLSLTSSVVENIIQQSIEKLKNVFRKEEQHLIFEVLLKTDFENSSNWKRLL